MTAPLVDRPSAARAAAPPPHVFSVDVEEYFQVNAFEGIVDRDSWASRPSRVVRAVETLLEALARHDARGTFFTLGWIAEHHPDVVRRIAAAGHEIASHGYWHRRVMTLTPDAFRQDVRESKAALEDVVGAPVVGYRAPSFSITPGCEWAFDVLLEEGYRYDSSRFPIRRRGYGAPGTGRTPYGIPRASGELLEFPLATWQVAGTVLPAAGGGYLRQFPFFVVRRAFRDFARAGQSAMFYIHPWEVDPDQPRLPVPLVTRLRHYRGLSRTMPRIERLLREFRFTSVVALYPSLLDDGGRA